MAGEEKRNFLSTIIDPKILPILIPVLIAVFSAFLVHDRTIHQVLIREEQSRKEIIQMRSDIDLIKGIDNKMILDVSKLVAELRSNSNNDRDAHNQVEETEELAKRLEQKMDYNSMLLADLKVRIRDIERIMDRRSSSMQGMTGSRK